MTTFLLPERPITSMEEYLATEIGGEGFRAAQAMGPRATIDVITASGLRGRGGGGFPTGRKWAGIAGQDAAQRYLVCNAAEGEPGTFKDRALLRANPYQFIEGLIIAAYAIQATGAYVCLKASFEREVLSIESCGQCPPCKMGSGEITTQLERLEHGEGTDREIEVIGGWLERVTDGNRCFLAVEEQRMVSSVLRAFPEEFAEHIEQHRCPRPAARPMPKIVDLADGHAVYDETFWRKRPDWTYDPA